MPIGDPLVHNVAADLRYLRDEWGENIDDHSLRRSSIVLRRLLVDNELQRAWKAAGFTKEPKLTGSTLTSILSSVPKKKIIFASAGGAKYQGMELRGALVTNYATEASEVEKHRSAGVPEETFGLQSFIAAPCIVVQGNTVSRRMLVQYVANKLGGAHWNPKRGRSQKERLFSLLDQAAHQVQLLGKSAVYYELLATGQAIARADDITGFLEKVSE